MRSFEIVHDDADIVVVDKAPGVLTVPTHRRERNTLVQLVSNALRREVFVVHRLDRDTSGLLVFAKSERAANTLKDRWREDHERIYAAIVHGVIKQNDGVIESMLVTDPRTLTRRSLRPHEEARAQAHANARAHDERAHDGHDGRRDHHRRPRDSRGPRSRRAPPRGEPHVHAEDARTRYRVVLRLQGATLVDVELDTGRRNQIRVHMAELGHPILGDERYARTMPPHPLWREGRLALHARLLVIVQPRTREKLRLESPLPDAFKRFLVAAR